MTGKCDICKYIRDVRMAWTSNPGGDGRNTDKGGQIILLCRECEYGSTSEDRLK